jgi:hypothetical protein
MKEKRIHENSIFLSRIFAARRENRTVKIMEIIKEKALNSRLAVARKNKN